MRLPFGKVLNNGCRWTLPGMLLLTACAVGAVPGCTRDAAREGEVCSGRVIARVNGRPLHEEQLRPELEATLQKFRKYGMKQADPALVQRRQQRILDRLIGDQLIYQESQKLAIESLEELVGQELKALHAKYGGGERFKRFLRSKGLTRTSLRESLRAKVRVAEYLRRRGISDPDIPEARIREAYEKHPDAYTREETVKVSHILIEASRDSGPAAAQQAHEEAERIRRQILNGEDFGTMARKHSDCNSASGGGDLGYVERGYLPTEFDRVAFSLEPDTVSEVVETRFGFHIVKVVDRKPAGMAPLEEVRPIIRKFLQQEESGRRLAAHIEELKQNARIEILLDGSSCARDGQSAGGGSGSSDTEKPYS